MSILSDYERIRREIGEEKYAEIERYLNAKRETLLSDIYYTEKGWKAMEEWCKENPKRYCTEPSVYNSGGGVIIAEMPFEYNGIDCYIAMGCPEEGFGIYKNRYDEMADGETEFMPEDMMFTANGNDELELNIRVAYNKLVDLYESYNK